MKEFYLKNYWAASYLKNIGTEPMRIELTPKGRRIFFYENNEELQKHIHDFYNDTDLQNFIRACINLKIEMYNQAPSKRSKEKQ